MVYRHVLHIIGVYGGLSVLQHQFDKLHRMLINRDNGEALAAYIAIEHGGGKGRNHRHFIVAKRAGVKKHQLHAYRLHRVYGA